MVDGEIDGSIYGPTHPSIYGSENGARNNNPSERIINSGGRIIAEPFVVQEGLLFRALLTEPDWLGYIVPCMVYKKTDIKRIVMVN